MRSVLSWAALGVDLDIHSIQYEKTTKTVCHCYYVKRTGCPYSKLMAINDIVRFFLL